MSKQEELSNFEAAVNHLKLFGLTPDDALGENDEAEYARDIFFDSIDDITKRRVSSSIHVDSHPENSVSGMSYDFEPYLKVGGSE